LLWVLLDEINKYFIEVSDTHLISD